VFNKFLPTKQLDDQDVPLLLIPRSRQDFSFCLLECLKRHNPALLQGINDKLTETEENLLQTAIIYNLMEPQSGVNADGIKDLIENWGSPEYITSLVSLYKKHQEAKAHLASLQSNTIPFTDLIYFKKRVEAKTHQDDLEKAQIEIARLNQAKRAYDIEIANITKQQSSVSELENELSGPRFERLPQAAKEKKKKKLDAEKALLDGSLRAMKSLSRTFLDNASVLGTTTKLVLERGDNSLGFFSQVLEEQKVPGVLSKLNVGPTDMGKVNITSDADNDLYYLNTPVKNTEVIVSTKTYQVDQQACIVQSKHATVDRSVGITAKEDLEEVAMQTALMFILNRGKGQSITIRGSDVAQIQRVHATLIWMKHLSKKDLKTMTQRLTGASSKNPNLDISKLNIISNASGPDAPRWGKGQKNQEQEFIKGHMPCLLDPSSAFKQKLINALGEEQSKPPDIYRPVIKP
jgi:hypothetical protein